MNRPIVKAPAAKDPLISGTLVMPSILGDAVDVARKHILAPFPHVARQVIDAELIRRLLCHRLGVITFVPGENSSMRLNRRISIWSPPAVAICPPIL